MKKLVVMLMVGIMSISMIGCGRKKSDKEVKTDTKANEIDKPSDLENDWYAKDNTAITSGVYIVGKDINPGTYIFSLLNEDISAPQIMLFENIDRYNDYLDSDRSEAGLRGQALTNTTMETFRPGVEGDVGNKEIVLSEGNVVMIWGNGSTMRSADFDGATVNAITEKIKKLGNNTYTKKDLDGTFFLTVPKDGYTVSAYIFDSKDEYDEFKKVDRDEDINAFMAAEEKYTYFHDSVYDSHADGMYVNLTKDQVLYVDGPMYAEEVEMAWSEK